MADLGELKIPAATRPAAKAIIALTDQVCAELLDNEYASLARNVVAKLARKRPSPIQSGRASTWAGAVIYALGQVNFLFDSATKTVRDGRRPERGDRRRQVHAGREGQAGP